MLPIALIARHIHGHSRRKAHAFVAVSWPMRTVTDCTPRWVETRGIGTTLLRRAEAFAREADARALRIGVLGANGEARRLYLAAEFVPHLEIFAKHLS